MILTAVAALTLAANPMENIVGNTAVVTYADGSQSQFYFAEDGTFTTDAEGVAGTWRLDGTSVCLTVVVQGQAGEESCTELGDEIHEVGDTWTLPDGEGGEFSVTLEEGQG
jgi:hypothetical protein